MTYYKYLSHNEKLEKCMKIKTKNRHKYGIINVLLSTLIVFMVFAYVVQINSIATKGYKIKDLEHKLIELRQISQDLQSEAFKLQSIDNVSKKIDGMEMEVAKNIEYIPQDNSLVSTR